MKNEFKNIPSPKEVVEKYELKAKKSLGQNFLLDLNITTKIANSAGELAGRNVIEIGPGPGGLTQALLYSEAKHVYAIEKDERFIEAFQPVIDGFDGRLTVINNDALKVNAADICEAPRVIVANLPYNVATPLLVNWLEHIEDYESMTLMFQKEVADRICAPPKNKIYGRLSIISQWLCKVEKKFDLPPEAFTPRPKITSSIVHFTPRARKDNVKFSTVEKITNAAFGQRRKMIRMSLKSLVGERTQELLAAADIKETLRAEEVPVDKFILLAQKFEEMKF